MQAANDRVGVGADERGIGRIAFVGPAPARIFRHRNRRREHPGDPRRPDRPRGGVADADQQLRIMRRAETDVVREKRCAVDVVVAVNRVGSPDHRDLDRHVGRHRRVVEALRQCEPVGHARVLARARPGTAAIEDGPEIIAPDILRSHRPDVGLGHLPDLLLERHPGDDPADQRFVRRGITGCGVSCLRSWPARRVWRGPGRTRRRRREEQRPGEHGPTQGRAVSGSLGQSPLSGRA